MLITRVCGCAEYIYLIINQLFLGVVFLQERNKIHDVRVLVWCVMKLLRSSRQAERGD